jgi:hypothetical protein
MKTLLTIIATLLITGCSAAVHKGEPLTNQEALMVKRCEKAMVFKWPTSSKIVRTETVKRNGHVDVQSLDASSDTNVKHLGWCSIDGGVITSVASDGHTLNDGELLSVAMADLNK